MHVIYFALATGRLHETADVPQYMVFRSNVFPFMFLFLAVSVFSFSPGLILWAGCSIAIDWMTVFVHLTRHLESPLKWPAERGRLMQSNIWPYSSTLRS